MVTNETIHTVKYTSKFNYFNNAFKLLKFIIFNVVQ